MVRAARKLDGARRLRKSVAQCLRNHGGISADVFTIGAPRARKNPDEDQIAGPRRLSGEARSVRSRLYPDAEETKFRAEKSSARAADEQRRSDHVHSRHRTQFAGALDRARSRRPREGSAWRSLPRDSR